MTYEDFLKLVQPNMLDANGRFRGPDAGVNYQAEGMTPQEFYDFMNQQVEAPNARDGADAGPRARGVADPRWQPGVVSTKAGLLGNWGVPLAMLASVYGGGALLGGGGSATGGAVGGLGATEGTLGLASTSPVVGGTAGVTATDLGALGSAGGVAGGGYGALGSGTYGLGGSLTTGAYPGSVLAADSVIAPTTIDTIMGGAGVGAGTLGGATDAAGALIGNGSAAAGAASMTMPASGGLLDTVKQWVGDNPTLMKLAGAALGAAASGDTKTSATSSKDPWAPAQPYLLQNLAQNQAMSDHYNANPFSQEQQNAYQGLLSTVANSQAAGNGLLSMASNFGRSNRGVMPQFGPLGSAQAPAINWSQYQNIGRK